MSALFSRLAIRLLITSWHNLAVIPGDYLVLGVNHKWCALGKSFQ
jgi:hypothetical protein